MQNRGNSPRMNRNMIVFLAPDAKRYEELDQAVRDFLAWQSIAATEERIRELDLSAQQAAQAKKKLRDADETVNLRIGTTYQWLLVPVQSPGQSITLDESKTDTAKEHLADRASDKLRYADRLRVVQGARNIQLDLDQHLSGVWERGHIRVGDLWDYYCKYVYLPRLSDRAVLDKGIVGVFDELTWDVEGFAVAAGYDDASGRYLGLAIPHQDTCPQITDSTLLVRPERAIAQREQELAEREATRVAAGAGETTTSPDELFHAAQRDAGSDATGGLAGAGGAGTPAPGPKNTRFYGVARINPERYGRDFNRLQQEVIQHLAAPEGVDLEISVEITARKKDGYPDDKVRIVTENARTLKFDSYGFEDR
jgi:hypothetical protein